MCRVPTQKYQELEEKERQLEKRVKGKEGKDRIKEEAVAVILKERKDQKKMLKRTENHEERKNE